MEVVWQELWMLLLCMYGRIWHQINPIQATQKGEIKHAEFFLINLNERRQR